MTGVELGAGRPVREWRWGVLLFGLVMLAYGPMYLGGGGGFIWDDPDYVINNPNLRDWEGLRRTWLVKTSLPQWYPLVHTTFWVEYQVWGLWSKGYHVVNAVLHGVGVLLLWRVLRGLGFGPGAAVMGAAVWGLHPVQVESVAWITERKNTLSGMLYFASAMALLKWNGLVGDTSRRQWGWYGVAFGLFVLALLSKTVVASLPAAWLVVVWWKRGRITRQDVLAMLPLFAIGYYFASITAHLEREHVGAQGVEWAFGFWERLWIAGRGVWFYLACLGFPVGLAFMYERVIPGAVWGWIAAGSVVLVLVGLWAGSRGTRPRIGRGWFAGGAIFVGTVFPALGFVNVFPHRYSFVADHFQYIASVGVLAGVGWWAGRWPGVVRGGLVVVLVGLTMGRAVVFRDELTLWEDTARKTPGNWMVWTNLARVYGERSDAEGLVRDARREVQRKREELLKRAVEVADNVGGRGDALITLGYLYEEMGRKELAASAYDQAAEVNPQSTQAWVGVGRMRFGAGDFDGARLAVERALKISEKDATAWAALGEVLVVKGEWKEAEHAWRQATGRDGRSAEWKLKLGRVLLKRAVEMEPESVERDSLTREAGLILVEVVKKMPADARARLEAGRAAWMLGQREEGEKLLSQAVELDRGLSAEAEEIRKGR